MTTPHRTWLAPAVLGLALCLNACSTDDALPNPCDTAGVAGNCVGIRGDEADTTAAIKSAMLEAEAGDTIVLPEGRFELTDELSILANDITVRGQGMGKTILDFRGSTGRGGYGIKADTVSGLVLEDFAVVNTQADAIFLPECRNLTVTRVRVEWEDGPDEANGRYGIYPVRCSGVLIDGSISRGASDAGIYVGESDTIVVKNNVAWENVAGIQIENSVDSEVFDNVATNNTAGLMIFDLPGKLSNKNGGRHLVYNNRSESNNTPNFGDPSAIVGALPAGIGAVIIATNNVEFRNNEIKDNQSVSIGIVNYEISLDDFDDPEYFPYPQTVYVHDNTISGGGDNVQVFNNDNSVNDIGTLMSLFFPDGVSDVVYDGIVTDPSPGTPAAITETNPHYICIRDNTADGEPATFANLHADEIDPDDFNTVTPEVMTFDQAPYDCEGPTQARVTLDF